ncbi:MAG TPA: S8 family serine peptidase, partial [Phycisphaerae bacterium]
MHRALVHLTMVPFSLLLSATVARAADSPQALASHQAAIARLQQNNQLQYDPATVLVRFVAQTPEAARTAARALVGGQKLRDFTLVPDLELISVGVEARQAANLLQAQPSVQYAEPDFVVHAVVIPNDTYFNLEWGLNNTGQTVNGDPGTNNADINGPEAWNVSTGDASFVIADIDTGMQLNHPDLAANLWTNPGEIAGNGIDDDGDGYVDDVHGWDFYSHDNDPSDSDGHGTHTAGTIGAIGNNGIGVAGVNWACKIAPLRFLGPNGGYTSDAVLAVQYCTAKGIKASNNSWGGGSSQSLYDAINAAKSVGHIFVAAAGNNGTNNDSAPFYPASYNLDNIISVAATDNDDHRASFSNYGATSVDLGAPGVNVASTYTGSNYAYLSGTSMATPHVTGVVALVYGLHPTWTYQQVRSQILSTTRPVSALAGITVTGGVLNAAAAVGAGSGNTPPSVSITSPANGASFAQGATITFTGSASDTQDGDLSVGLVWTSNLQGQIGTGASFVRNDLVVGTHTITASVTDSGGLSGSASITLTIQNPNSPPSAPTNTTAANNGGGQATVQWTDNSNNESGFEIQREHRVGPNWVETVTAGTVSANVTTFVDTPGNGRFRYR